MTKIIYRGIAILLYMFFLIIPCQADRITLFAGDIFIGKIKELTNYRYTIERGDDQQIIPQWFIKKIERGIDILPAPVNENILAGTGSVRLKGRTIPVTSASPAKADHLELYSWRGHFWKEPERYLRGYLVNEETTAFRKIEVSFHFYTQNKKDDLQLKTEVFDSYPQTMKPFIIDTRGIIWSNIQSIRIETTAITIMR